MNVFPDCSTSAKAEKVKLEDSGRSLIVHFDDECEYVTTRLDGCVFKQERSADFLVENDKLAAIVELKGKDVRHAMAQIAATASKLRGMKKLPAPTHGIIFSRRCPLTSSSLQSEKNKLFRSHNVRVFVSSSNNNVTVSTNGCKFA